MPPQNQPQLPPVKPTGDQLPPNARADIDPDSSQIWRVVGLIVVAAIAVWLFYTLVLTSKS